MGGKFSQQFLNLAAQENHGKNVFRRTGWKNANVSAVNHAEDDKRYQHPSESFERKHECKFQRAFRREKDGDINLNGIKFTVSSED